jgi:multiple sugar transport system ATP-binding protein
MPQCCSECENIDEKGRLMASVDVLNVQKKYGQLKVINGVTVNVEDGQFIALVGPSGCGKSTLLRIIAGLESLSSGEIKIGDRDVTALQPKDRDIAMVFQSYALYPHKTVAENMAFALRLRHLPDAEVRERVARAADILDLSALLERYPRQLSGGQRQRVAMGRAIVRDPAVFLFDEPLSNLDAKLRVQMRAEIKELHQRLRTTTVYVTHDQVEAMTMADKIVVMNNGEIEQEGSPLELYDNPKNVFVASFIGSPSMNMLNGVIEGASKAYFVLPEGQRIALLPQFIKYAGRNAILGIRPEHIELADNGTLANISVVEPLGSETQLFTTVGKQKVVGVFRSRLNLQPAQKIGFHFPPGLVHLFDDLTKEKFL